MILRSYKCCTRMCVFTRNINLSITVSTKRKTNADIAEDPGEESEEAEEGEAEEGAPVLRAGRLGAPRPRLCAQRPGKGSSVTIQHRENKRSRKLPLRLTAFQPPSVFKAFIQDAVATMKLCISQNTLISQRHGELPGESQLICRISCSSLSSHPSFSQRNI